MKVITHELIINIADRIAAQNYKLNKTRADDITLYVRQQKKQEKLLDLYKQYAFTNRPSERVKLRERILALENGAHYD